MKPLQSVLASALFLLTNQSLFGQVAGQPYQIPAGFETYPIGTLITYGGFNYVIQPGGTMLLAADQPAPPQQYVYTTPVAPTTIYSPYVNTYPGFGYGYGYWGGVRPWRGSGPYYPGPWRGPGPFFPGRGPGPFIGGRGPGFRR